MIQKNIIDDVAPLKTNNQPVPKPKPGINMIQLPQQTRVIRYELVGIAVARIMMMAILSVFFFEIDNLATAQMFGNRNVGQPLDRRNPLSVAAESDTLTGGERFLRDNRDPRQFIGGTPGNGGFVGMVEATDPANVAALPQVSLPGMRPDRSAIINRPLNLRQPNSMMAPQLSIGFSSSFQSSSVQTNVGLAQQAQTSLDRLLATRFPSQFEASVAGSVATLRGVARNQEQRQLVEIMTAMEPGIDEVRNRIVINSAPLPNPAPLPSPQAVR